MADRSASATRGKTDTEHPARPGHEAERGPRVVLATDAEAGESLIGLVVRAARRNHLPRLRPLIRACTAIDHAYLYLATRNDIDFGRLAYTARLAREHVEDRRYRPIMLSTTLPGVQFHGARIPTYDLDLRYRRLATTWLAGEGVHCALGHHGLATHCPISGSILVDSCSQCDSRLTWASIDLSRCDACGCELTPQTAQRVTQRELIATRLMLDLIHPDPARHQPAIDSLHRSLRGLDRGTVFELGWRFGVMLVGGDRRSRTNAKCLPIPTRLRILEAGTSVLRHWPASVRSLMQGIAPDSSITNPTLPRSVRSVARASNAWPALRDAIYSAVPDLKVSASAGVRSMISIPANCTELTRKLGVSQRVFARLRSADVISPVASSGTVNLHQIFDAATVPRLEALLADCIPLSAASERLGISLHGAEQLCCLGQLRLLDEKAVIAGLKGPQISKTSLDALSCRLEERPISLVTPAGLASDVGPVRRALRTFGGREKPWGLIVQAMLRGNLPFAIDPDVTGPLFSRVIVPVGASRLISTMLFDVGAHPTFDFGSRINRRDAEEMLNVDPPTFSRAVNSGELPATTGATYDRVVILGLARRYLSISEALARWPGGGRSLPPPLKGKHAPSRIGKLGWDRETVESLMEA